MSYFSVITCPGCGQKITLTPEQISDSDNQLGYRCRRCRYEGVLDDEFVFKHPTKRDLPIRQAMHQAKKGGSFLGMLGSLFRGG